MLPDERPLRRYRIVVAEDHPVVLDGTVELLKREPDFEVCGQAATESALLAALQSNPDVLLMDLFLGGSDGLDVIAQVNARYPDLPILVLSAHSEIVYAERALRAGALGYVMKTEPTEEMMLGLRTVARQQIYLSPRIAAPICRVLAKRSSARKDQPVNVLSDRELHIFNSCGLGKQNKQVAAELSISVKTVETHKENIKRKLKLADTSHLAEVAREFAWSNRRL